MTGKTRIIGMVVLLAGGAVVFLYFSTLPSKTEPLGHIGNAAPDESRQATASTDSAAWAPAATPAPSVVVPNEAFQRRPFAAAITNGLHGWTAEDGCDTNVIARLAHNNLEYQGMVDENARISRRQLVYRNDPVAAVMQRAKLTDDPVNRIVLPGLDGMEYDVVVTARDLAPSSQIGTLSGYVEGMPDSLVTVAYKFGREAFTIEFPEARYGLQGDPREPGEVIVKSFDIDVYHQGAICGNEEESSPQSP